MFFLFRSFLVTTGVARGPCPVHISSISCHFVLLQAVPRTKYCCSLKVKVFAPRKNFGLAALLLCHTDGLHLSRARHVLQYHAFQTALFYLMFHLPLAKSSQQRKTARHCWTPMKSSIVILILRNKQHYRVVTVLIISRHLHFRSFQSKLWSYASEQFCRF